MPDVWEGVMPGVETLFPDPALDELYTPGRVASCTATSTAALEKPPWSIWYDDGSLPVAGLVKARTRVYSWLDCWPTATVHPEGTVMSLTLPVSVATTSTSTSPAVTPVGRLMV